MLLDLWAFLDPGDVWAELLVFGDCKAAKNDPAGDSVIPNATKLSIQHSIGILAQYSMVTGGTASTRHAVHPVVHAWCLHNLGESATKREALAAALRCVAKMAQSTVDGVTKEDGLRLATHARAIAGSMVTESEDRDAHEACFHIANFLFDWEKSKEVEILYMRALRGYEKTRGSDHTDTLMIAINLGNLFLDQDKIAKAEEMYLRALRGYEALGPDPMGMLMTTVNNLGNLYVKQGKMAEAEDMYLRALRGYEALGPDRPGTLMTVNNLGNLYSGQGKFVQANEMYLRALRGKEKILGMDHASTLDTVNNLGVLYSGAGQIAEAEEMYLRALHGFEKARGPDHTLTLDTVNNLGILYKQQGKMAEAEEMYLRALRGKEKAWGPDHTSTLDTVHNLGFLYSEQGTRKIAEAEEMYLRALRGKEKAWGPDHTSTLDTVYLLGFLYSNQGKGRMAEAEELYLRALRGYEKAGGPNHVDTLSIVDNLGKLYWDQGRLSEAEEMFLRAIQGFQRTLGPDHTSTLRTLCDLGNLYKDQGKMAEGEKMWLRVISTAPLTSATQSTVVDLALGCLLVFYRQRASESISIRSGRQLRLLSALTFPDCRPHSIWNKVLGLRTSLERSPAIYSQLYSLGRILQGIGDESNAAYAFQAHRAIGYVVRCNGCNRVLLATENQYACKTCDDTDFCEDCWLRCRSDDVQEFPGAITQCAGHSFCKVPSFEKNQESSVAEEAAKAWITELFESGPTFAT
jgi:tetratricopeptide (TPR) repeat protein